MNFARSATVSPSQAVNGAAIVMMTPFVWSAFPCRVSAMPSPTVSRSPSPVSVSRNEAATEPTRTTSSTSSQRPQDSTGLRGRQQQRTSRSAPLPVRQDNLPLSGTSPTAKTSRSTTTESHSQLFDASREFAYDAQDPQQQPRVLGDVEPKLEGATNVVLTNVSAPPSPRLDLKAAFSLSRDGSGNHVFEYGRATKHGLKATLDANGELSFHVNVQKDLRATRGGGRDMFVSLMQRIDGEGLQVNSIAGEWVGKLGTGQSANLDQYVKNCKMMSQEDAAMATWTGQRAAEFGFTKATIAFPLERNGADHEVEVLFEKPTT